MRFYNVAATILLASAGFAAAKKCEAQKYVCCHTLVTVLKRMPT